MSILIKGMEMPKSCDACPCFLREYFYCNAKENNHTKLNKRPQDCPLVELPPHGRLIDADAFGHEIWLKYCEKCESEKDGGYLCGLCPVSDVMEMLKKFPAIIESEVADG